jgi:hypothetical protein
MDYRCAIYEGGDPFCEGTEVFALGVVLLEIVTGHITVVGTKGNLYHYFISRKRALCEHFDTRAEGDGEWPMELKTRLVQLINDCLQDLPEDRICVQEILR